ncbi:MAG TPA: tripartite tricarboxylate transporter substrate binding protein [Burkholderiales bacterium]|nr:tripartite tricarboxylate transporter substrate binding protein [Burkholderiales bacterium]
MLKLRAILCLLLFSVGLAHAQGWPQRSVRWLVPFPPGGSTDVAARALADKVSAGLGQQVVVENRGGGGGAVGAAEVARAQPDGYTVLFAANAVTILHLAVKNLPYDTLRDFLAVTQATTQPNAFAIHPAVPANNIKELVAYAKANPGKLAYAHSGAGGGQHLTGELLKKLAGIDMLGVPYKGGGQVITDLIGGQVQVGIAGTTPLIPHHKAGRIKILAFTSLERFPPMPEIPTVAEAGYPGFESTQWLGLLVPRGTPSDAIKRLHEETVKALQLPDVRDRLLKAGLLPVGNSSEEFTRVIRAEIEQWSKLAKELGVEPQ